MGVSNLELYEIVAYDSTLNDTVVIPCKSFWMEDERTVQIFPEDGQHSRLVEDVITVRKIATKDYD